jgi:hypothetical protein
VQDFGCVVKHDHPDDPKTLPQQLSVSGGATPKDCAQFEISTEEGKYQFKELYVVRSFLPLTHSDSLKQDHRKAHGPPWPLVLLEWGTRKEGREHHLLSEVQARRPEQ